MAEGVVPCGQKTGVLFDRSWSPKSARAPHNYSRPDIIVVHDLASHRPISCIQDEEGILGVFWLEDILERDLPRSEITSFRPTSDAAPETVFTPRGLEALGLELLQSICKERDKHNREQNEIVFIVSGIGSLIVKKALLIAQDGDLFESIRDQTSTLVPFGPFKSAIDVRSREILALNMMGSSVKQCRYGLPRTIETFSVAIAEILKDFSAIASRYKIVADEFLSTFEMPSEEQSCAHRTPLKLKSPSEDAEDKLLMISDKIRSLAQYELTSRGEWYSDYLSMLSHLHWQQYTCTPVSEHPETLTWLFSHDTYLAWVANTDPCMLYVHGQYGVGKTTLSSFLWKSLLAASQAGEDDADTTLYFTFLREDKRRNSTKSFLSSIIYQILAYRPLTFLSIQSHFDWIQCSWPLTVEELWIIFRSLVSCPTHEGIICIIDAIDQCNDPFDTTLQEILAFSASREIRFKVVATSRIPPESFHQPQLFSINLDLQKEIRMDVEASIKIYLHELLQANAAFLEFEKELVEEFQKRRTLLEAVLGFESLKSPTLRSTPWSIRGAIQSLECSLSDLCHRTLHEISNLPPWARTALSWIVHAFRPLTFDELSVAVAIRETTNSYSEIENDVPRDIARDLKQVFGGMLSANYDGIRFTHQSVKEYLLIHLTSPSQNRLSLNLTHAELARCCLAYLSFTDLGDNLPSKPVKASFQDCSSLGKFDLLYYAADHWPEHYRRAERRGRLNEIILEFLRNPRTLERWHKARSRERSGWARHSRPVSPLQVAGQLGLTEIVAMLLSHDGINSTIQNDKEAALDMAIDNSHPEVSIQLLNDGTTSSRALSLAARHGNTDIVEKLIHKTNMKPVENDGKPNTDRAPDFEKVSDTDGFSPLHLAALRGHTAIIGTLLGAGAIPQSINALEGSSFSEAVKGGQLVALKQLLAVDSTIALADSTESSLLHLAAREGHLDIVRELIVAGADANAVGKHMSTPLLLAAERGHVVLVRELLNEFGADVQAANEAGSRAVHVAAANGHIRVFEQLSKARADMNTKDNDGSQPIHLAAKGGHLRVIQSLLELDVDSGTVDGRRLTPLHLAAREGHSRIVQELLDHSRRNPKLHDPKPNSRVGTGGLTENAEKESKDHEASEDDGEADGLPDDDDGEADGLPDDYDASSGYSYETEEYRDDSASDSNFHHSNDATPLHSAAVRGYVEIIRELLKADAQWDTGSKHDLTPLHLAAKEGYSSVVKELLQHNADPNTTDVKGSSPLHAASTAGNLSLVKVLLGFGAAVSKTDDDHVSPLHHAARHGHIDVVRHLLEAGAELEATDATGQTPLHIAVKQRHCDIVTALLAQGAKPDTKSKLGWTALHLAVSGEHVEIGLIVQLLQGGVDIHASNGRGSTALFMAAESGSEAAVKLLLDAGANTDARNNANSTPMHRAAQEGHLAVVKLLMGAGANPLAKKRHDITPLQLALEGNHLDVVAQLLEPTESELPSIEDYEGCLYSLARVGFEEGISKAFKYPLRNLERGDPKYKQSPLSHAAEIGHKPVVQMLLDKDAQPNSADVSGRTALFWAIINGHGAIAEILLASGADINSKDHDQWTSLHFAIQNSSAPMVKLLLEKGADVSATVTAMITPLHMAAQYDELAVVRLLVENGASLSSYDVSQVTPLDYAVRFGSFSMVELLLDLGASHSAPSLDGLTAIDLAMERGDKFIVDLLVRRSSDTFVGQQGWTKLHLAALSGNRTSMREQLEEGADKTARDRNGLMALHWAAARSHEDVVHLLLEMDTDIQAEDNEGMTALHHAASRGNTATVRALLERGAGRKIIDHHGWTPFQIAQVYANNEVRDIISDDNETTMVPGARYGLAPSCWIKAIDSSDITISEDGLTAIADKVNQLELDAGLQIRADHPMPAGDYVFYFEVVIVNAGSENIVGIGFCEGGSQRIGMPGWYMNSWGYHGDDGKNFQHSGTRDPYGPTYGTGDIVGCGVDFMSRSAFFTKNGEKLDTAFTDIKGRLYPMVGIGDREAKVTVNFGPNNFLFKDLP